jgi:hypothetical protein
MLLAGIHTKQLIQRHFFFVFLFFIALEPRVE